jgi:hypothetical protein
VLEALENARLAMRETGLAPRLQEVRWRWWISVLARPSRRAGFVADRPASRRGISRLSGTNPASPSSRGR